MVWTVELQRILTLSASLLLTGIFLSGCVDDSPRTHLTWFPASDSPIRPHATVRPADPAQQTASFDRPLAHPRPAWYSASVLPPLFTPRAPATSTYTGVPTFDWPTTG